jgi:hypothetical protein
MGHEWMVVGWTLVDLSEGSALRGDRSIFAEAMADRSTAVGVSTADEADLDAVVEADEEVAATAAGFGEAFAGEADDFVAAGALGNLDAKHGAGEAANHFDTALRGASGFDLQIATEIGATDLELEVGQGLDADLKVAAGESAFAWQAKAGAGSGFWGHDERIGFGAVRIGGVVDADFADDAMEEIGEAQVHIEREMALDFGVAAGGVGFFWRVEFEIVGLAAGGIAEGFVGGVELLGAVDGLGRMRIEIGMMLAGEDAVGGADLREGALAIEAERGVVGGGGALQPRKLTGERRRRQLDCARRGLFYRGRGGGRP